jgi:hypothetical protein
VKVDLIAAITAIPMPMGRQYKLKKEMRLNNGKETSGQANAMYPSVEKYRSSLLIARIRKMADNERITTNGVPKEENKELPSFVHDSSYVQPHGISFPFI